MKTYTYRRTGSRPLQFEGEHLADISTADHNENRWFEAKLAITKGGSYVVAVTYFSRWEKENDLYFAHHGTAEEVSAWLEGFDFMQGVLGIPTGVQNWAEKQARLEKNMRSHWGQVVSALCTELGPEIID